MKKILDIILFLICSSNAFLLNSAISQWDVHITNREHSEGSTFRRSIGFGTVDCGHLSNVTLLPPYATMEHPATVKRVHGHAHIAVASRSGSIPTCAASLVATSKNFDEDNYVT